MTVEPFSPDAECSDRNGCDGATRTTDIGQYVFSVHIMPSDEGLWFPVDAVQFAYTWPADWEVTGVWICEGATLVSGDPYQPDSVLEIELGSCVHPGEWPPNPKPALLQFVIDCTSPGPFMRADDAMDTGMRTCDSESDGYPSGTWTQDFWQTSLIAIGDYCGRLILRACEYCDWSQTLAGSFLTPELDLTLDFGSSIVDTVHVRDHYCGGLPAECGSTQYNDPCVDDLRASVPWITTRSLSEDDEYDKYYEVSVSTVGLEPGDYQTRLNVWDTGCIDCQPNCQELRLTVLPRCRRVRHRGRR